MGQNGFQFFVGWDFIECSGSIGPSSSPSQSFPKRLRQLNVVFDEEVSDSGNVEVDGLGRSAFEGVLEIGEVFLKVSLF